MVIDEKGVTVVSGWFVVGAIVRPLIVPNGIRQCDGSVDHQDRSEEELQEKDGVL